MIRTHLVLWFALAAILFSPRCGMCDGPVSSPSNSWLVIQAHPAILGALHDEDTIKRLQWLYIELCHELSGEPPTPAQERNFWFFWKPFSEVDVDKTPGPLFELGLTPLNDKVPVEKLRAEFLKRLETWLRQVNAAYRAQIQTELEATLSEIALLTKDLARNAEIRKALRKLLGIEELVPEQDVLTTRPGADLRREQTMLEMQVVGLLARRQVLEGQLQELQVKVHQLDDFARKREQLTKVSHLVLLRINELGVRKSSLTGEDLQKAEEELKDLQGKLTQSRDELEAIKAEVGRRTKAADVFEECERQLKDVVVQIADNEAKLAKITEVLAQIDKQAYEQVQKRLRSQEDSTDMRLVTIDFNTLEQAYEQLNTARRDLERKLRSFREPTVRLLNQEPSEEKKDTDKDADK